MVPAEQQVLVVDDDPAISRLLGTIISSAGYRVTQAGDGREALAFAEQQCPHFLVTDWEMPGMTGLQLCEALRGMKLPHYVYVIMLTGRSAAHDTTSALNAGADDFARKPIDKGELLARMRSGGRVLDLERRLSLLANSDPLTGLATKRLFSEHLQRDWNRAVRYRTPLSCVMADIDFFKRVNDTYGHPAGDEVLRAVASLFTANCRASDFVARYGGEEMCALLPETDEEHAVHWAQRLCERIRETPITIEGKPLRITTSFGVASVDTETPSPADLVDRADQCLLAAKQAGRDRVVAASALRQLAAMYRDPQSGYGGTFYSVVARDVMTTIVTGLPIDATVGQAAKYFLRFRQSSAPVVDGAGKLIGFVSEKDLMNVLLWPDCWTRPIRDVMKSNVVCYDEDTPALAIYEFLSRVPFRSVVVVRDGVPTGTISRGALLRWFSNSVAIQRGGIEGTSPAQIGVADGRGRLAITTVAIGEQVAKLLSSLEDGAETDVLAHVVGGASRIQELVNDLLAGSHILRSDVRHGVVGALGSCIEAPPGEETAVLCATSP